MITSTAIVTVAFAASLTSTPGTLADWFVDADAADCSAGSGTPSAPFCTIGEALSAAVDGDRILIAPGTYAENLSIVDDVEIVGLEGRDVTIVDGGAAGSVITIASDVMVSIDGLTIQNGANSLGGGVLSAGDLVLTNSTVTANSAIGTFGGTTYGGGIALSNAGSTAIVNCSVTNNFSSSGNGFSFGGGISARSSESLLLSSCTIASNFSGAYASALQVSRTPFRMENSAIVDNLGTHAVDLYSNCEPAELLNSTISGNAAAAISAWSHCPQGASVRLDGVTVFDNGYSFTQFAPVQSFGDTTFELRNTVVAGNGGSGPDISGPVTSLGHNFIGRGDGSLQNGVNGDQVGTIASPIDPLLAPLESSGGATATHAPLPFSPLIGAGDPALSGTLDQRGFTRLGAPDIGAHEYAAFGGPRIMGCVSAPNSTGQVGATAAVGSTSLGDNALTLVASSMPVDRAVLFIASRSTGFTANPGFSAGNLCLGGAIGRFVGPGQVGDSGPEGRTALAIDLDTLPTPSGPVAALPGETWYFQAWHRDVFLPSGLLTSNFTAGTQLTLSL